MAIAIGSESACQSPNSIPPSGIAQYQIGSVARPTTLADQREREHAEREADDRVGDQPGEVAPDLRVAQRVDDPARRSSGRGASGSAPRTGRPNTSAAFWRSSSAVQRIT